MEARVREAARSAQADTKVKRREITSVFIAFLTAVAYQEMVAPVRDSVQSHGLNWTVVALFIVFFVTTIRFLIGCHLHLTSDELMRGPGRLWFFDLVTITLEMTAIIFMGGLTSAEASRRSPYGFFGILFALYILDVLWVVLQWIMHLGLRGWRRRVIPWQWAVLNTLLLGSMSVVWRWKGDPLDVVALCFMVGINVVGFFVDIVLIDRYQLL